MKAFAGTPASQLWIGAYLSVLAGLSFIPFTARVITASRRAERASGWLSTTALAGGILLVAAELGGAGAVNALLARAGHNLSAAEAMTLFDLEVTWTFWSRRDDLSSVLGISMLALGLRRTEGALKMVSESTGPQDASTRMLQMLNAFLTVQALSTAAALGIPDRLADGPRTVEDLATLTGAHRPSLYRLLRMLAGEGVFHEDVNGRFGLTTLGDALRSDGPDSVRDWALYVGAPETWQAWGQLRETVMTGEPGFVIAHGMSTYEYLAQHPELRASFDAWMTRQSDRHNAAIASAYDFSAFRTMVDVGGGQGSTLAALLQAHPTLHGILFDLPQVVAHPTPLESGQVLDRCEVIGGDMLQAVPEGADAYLIKRVLMIWPDEEAIRVLRNCADAMGDGGTVLVVEMVMPQGDQPDTSKPFDLLMLLANKGGRVRTESEFKELFRAAGLRLTRIIPTASPNSILETVRA